MLSYLQSGLRVILGTRKVWGCLLIAMKKVDRYIQLTSMAQKKKDKVLRMIRSHGKQSGCLQEILLTYTPKYIGFH